MSKPILSICIPTWNRAQYLEHTLLNIIKSIGDNYYDIEICISDNDSTDMTSQSVKEIQNEFTKYNIVYRKTELNVGFDRNLLNVIDMAKGNYCWLFGDDDLLQENAIEYVLKLIYENNPDVLFIDHIAFADIPEFEIQSYNPNFEIGSANFLPKQDAVDYIISNIQTLGFMGSIVYKKNTMKVYKGFYELKQPLFIHLYILLSNLQNIDNLILISKQLVGRRCDNDTFKDECGSVNARYIVKFEMFDYLYDNNLIEYIYYSQLIQAMNIIRFSEDTFYCILLSNKKDTLAQFDFCIDSHKNQFSLPTKILAFVYTKLVNIIPMSGLKYLYIFIFKISKLLVMDMAAPNVFERNNKHLEINKLYGEQNLRKNYEDAF